MYLKTWFPNWSENKILIRETMFFNNCHKFNGIYLGESNITKFVNNNAA